jgi:uncharacterized membrane protein YraQ (UPF0718 family)
VNQIDRFLVIFPSIVFEALPFIIIGALISGTLEELLPQQAIARLLPKRRARAIAGSALLGLIFPMCECGIVPVMRRLLGKGLPLSCAVAYMLAAPIINPVVIASTWAAFSGDRRVETGGDGLTSMQMVSLRVSLAFITAFIVGMVVEYLARRRGVSELVKPVHGHARRDHAHHDHEDGHKHDEHPHEHGPHCEHEHEHKHAHEGESGGGSVEVQGVAVQELQAARIHDAAATPELQRKTLGQRLVSISQTALHDFKDITCFLILGAFLASILRTMNVMESIPQLAASPFLTTPLMMLLAILMCLCSEADAFIAANMPVEIGLGGKIAFLVLGPMLDLKLYFMYTRVFRSRLIWTIIPTVIVTVLILSLAAHFSEQLWALGEGGTR